MTLVTPVYKRENIRFYTERCGFQIVGTERDGNTKLARFLMERQIWPSMWTVRIYHQSFWSIVCKKVWKFWLSQNEKTGLQSGSYEPDCRPVDLFTCDLAELPGNPSDLASDLHGLPAAKGAGYVLKRRARRDGGDSLQEKRSISMKSTEIIQNRVNTTWNARKTRKIWRKNFSKLLTFFDLRYII